MAARLVNGDVSLTTIIVAPVRAVLRCLPTNRPHRNVVKCGERQAIGEIPITTSLPARAPCQWKVAPARTGKRRSPPSRLIQSSAPNPKHPAELPKHLLRSYSVTPLG